MFPKRRSTSFGGTNARFNQVRMLTRELYRRIAREGTVWSASSEDAGGEESVRGEDVGLLSAEARGARYETVAIVGRIAAGSSSAQ